MSNGRSPGRPKDPQGRHIRIYCTLLNCPAHRVLGYASKALHVDLREKVNGSNNGNIEATLSTLKHKGWKSGTTLATSLYELRSLGFIAVTRGGGVENGSRVCTLYRFTDLPVFEHPKLGIKASPATNDYLQFEDVGKAEAALKTGVMNLREKAIEKKENAATRKKTTLQNLDRTAPKSGAVEAFTAPKSGAVDSAPLQNLEQTGRLEKGREPAPVNASGQIATEHGSESVCSKNCTPLYIATPGAHLEGVAVDLDPALKGGKPGTHTEKAAADPAPPTCQHPGCSTLTLGADLKLCTRHRLAAMADKAKVKPSPRPQECSADAYLKASRGE